MALRASTACSAARLALVAMLSSLSACAGLTDRRLAADSIDARHLAPLRSEWVGRQARSCEYQARARMMTLVIERWQSCPAAVVCEGRRASGDPACWGQAAALAPARPARTDSAG